MRVNVLKLFLALLPLVTWVHGTRAQSSPGLTYKFVPSAFQWNQYFAAKVDVNGGACNACTLSNIIFSGSASFPASVTFTGLVGTPNPTTMLVGSSITNGAVITGSGSVSDVTLLSSSGDAVLQIPHGTTQLNAVASFQFGASRANQGTLSGGVASNPALLTLTGSDTDVSFKIATKGSGTVEMTSAQAGFGLLTLATSEIGLTKIAESGSAPGAAGLKIAAVCGTNAGSAKIIAYAGTSTTPVTVVDNVGSGVTGC